MRKEKTYMDLISILEIIKEKEDFQHGKPQDEKQITALEKELHIVFPKSYRWLLKQYGYLVWSEGVILGPSNIPRYDLLTINKFARSEKLPEYFVSLPDDAFVFKEYGGGGYYMLFSSDSQRAGQVGLFLDETFNHEEQTWESFEAFLEDYYCS